MNQNHLIESLPRADRKRLLSHARSIELSMSDIVCDSGQKTSSVYFPVEGFISLLTQVDNHAGVEVGMVGREGMFGAHVALGVTTAPLRALVQGAGSAWKVESAAFVTEMKRSPALQVAMNRYVCVLMAQLATSAACLRYHQIEPRLARWLLMTQDRAHADSFRVTQEFIGYMLGVRRVGITVAARGLQTLGLIEYSRGAMTILDRGGLEAASCSCYATDRANYVELL